MKDERTLFERLETKIIKLAKPKKIDIDKKKPHLIRLQKGVISYGEAITLYHKIAIKFMGNFVEKHAKKDPLLDTNLQKAHMMLKLEDYLCFIWFTFLLLTFISVGAAVILSVLLKSFLPLFLLFVPIIAYFILRAYPSLIASSRKKDIDKKIAHAMTFVSTMASADVNVDVIFKELSKQKIYGEIQKEAQWLVRDTELLGKDILSALKDAIIRSPSTKLQDFLQGVVTTTLSGGKLKPYFIMKAQQFSDLAKIERKKTTETLGMLAES
ncbi:MAG: type II secretion system F family protein, partial [Candidatus Thermoplasmatota archaeon]